MGELSVLVKDMTWQDQYTTACQIAQDPDASRVVQHNINIYENKTKRIKLGWTHRAPDPKDNSHTTLDLKILRQVFKEYGIPLPPPQETANINIDVGNLLS